MPLLFPALLIALGVGGLVVLVTGSDDRDVPEHEPDIAQPMPGSTGYKLVDKILIQLTAAAVSAGLPLGLMVGWIAKESGGKLAETTKYDERGLFQLMPDESKTLGLDHQRLSTDLTYSINGGIALIGYYSGKVDKFGVASRGSAYFWLLTKLVHSMGDGAVQKIVKAARDAGMVSSWAALKSYALNNEAELLHETKHSPTKWFNFVDSVYKVGAPFGFGTADSITVSAVGLDYARATQGATTGTIFSDIPDPLDCL